MLDAPSLAALHGEWRAEIMPTITYPVTYFLMQYTFGPGMGLGLLWLIRPPSSYVSRCRLRPGEWLQLKAACGCSFLFAN
jgi:hypothetical protein